MSKIVRLIFLFLIMLVLASGADGSTDKKIRVYVSVLPQKVFVEQVAGDLARVEVLVGPGKSPTTYDPSPKQMISLAEADVFFRTGVPFEERLLEKVSSIMPYLNIVDLRKGITLRNIEEGDFHDEDHSHGAMDPHIWLDPMLVKTEAATIRDELIKIRPEFKDRFETGYNDFVTGLDSLDMYIRNKLNDTAGCSFFVFHPTFGYFADRYGLKQVAIESEGKEPGPKYLAELVRRAKDEKITGVVLQPQFSRKSGETIADAIHGKLIVIDPLPGSWEDYKATIHSLTDFIGSSCNGR